MSIRTTASSRQGLWFKISVIVLLVLLVITTFVFGIGGGPSLVWPGKLIFKKIIPSRETINLVVWSPDSRYIASANSNGTVWVLNAQTGNLLREYKSRVCHGNPSFCWINTLAW